MLTMVDEIYDRTYQLSRTELHLGIARMVGRLGHSVGNAFAVLNRIEYDAPWSGKSKRARCN
jgi:hypothetical protein